MDGRTRWVKDQKKNSSVMQGEDFQNLFHNVPFHEHPGYTEGWETEPRAGEPLKKDQKSL